MVYGLTVYGKFTFALDRLCTVVHYSKIVEDELVEPPAIAVPGAVVVVLVVLLFEGEALLSALSWLVSSIRSCQSDGLSNLTDCFSAAMASSRPR